MLSKSHPLEENGIKPGLIESRRGFRRIGISVTMDSFADIQRCVKSCFNNPQATTSTTLRFKFHIQIFCGS